MSFEVEHIRGCTLYRADCLEVMPTLEKVDRGVTDPPYGVSGGVGSGLRKQRKSKTNYHTDLFEDNPEYIASVVVPAVRLLVAKSRSTALTCGFRNMWLYDKPSHVGSFQYEGCSVMSSWGPCLWQPILFYGRDPRQGTLAPDSFKRCNDVDRETCHPCPKPLKQWTKLVDRASLLGETVLDPFMGSGTTGVACAKLGRKFIGIELDKQYFDIACERIEKAYQQPDLFIEQPDKPEQQQLFTEAAE